MSFEAFIMPSTPPPPTKAGDCSSGADAASFKPDRPTHSADGQKSFMATLNRVSERKSGCSPKSAAEDTRSVRSVKPDTKSGRSETGHNGVDRDPIQDHEALPEEDAMAQNSEIACRRPTFELIHEMLFKMTPAGDGARLVEGQAKLAGQVSIGPFEQLQTGISPEAFNLSFFKQLLNGSNRHPHATETSGPEAQHSFFELWRSMTATAGETGNPGGGAAAFASRIDEMINFLLQRNNNSIPLTSTQIPAAAANGHQAAVNMEALGVSENLLSKLIGEAQPAVAEKGGSLSEGVPKDVKPEILLEQHLRPGADYLRPAKEQPVPKAAETPVRVNSNGQLITAKPADESISLKVSGLRNDILSTDQTGGKVAVKPADESINLKASGLRNDILSTDQAGGKVAVKPADESISLKASGLRNDILSTDQTGGKVAVKPADESISLKVSGLPNNNLSLDQAGGKVLQIDAEAKDSGFLTSQENLPEHLSRLEHVGRTADGTQRSLASQTLNQIVQKAVFLNSNGQNAVQIDLKPDFLGHIRMQIVTESHQVAVRIVAEFPFVKDMLESNLNQLKTELQAQGLEVDELEVSVAHDSRADDDLYQKAAEARRARLSKNSRESTELAVEAQNPIQATRGQTTAEGAIDFFA